MGVHIETQDNDVLKQVRAREMQLENTEKLDIITEAVDNINLDNIESTTNEIKDIVVNNLEEQIYLDDLLILMEKISQGISDIKRNQTNINKKIKNLQEAVDNLGSDNNE